MNATRSGRPQSLAALAAVLVMVLTGCVGNHSGPSPSPGPAPPSPQAALAVTGSICDPTSNNYITGVTLDFTGADGVLHSATTNRIGRFQVNLRAGSYAFNCKIPATLTCASKYGNSAGSTINLVRSGTFDVLMEPSAPSPSPTPTPKPAVSGHVTSNGRPVAGVIVELRHYPEQDYDNNTVTTDANGYYAFDDPQDGVYEVTTVSGGNYCYTGSTNAVTVPGTSIVDWTETNGLCG